MTVCYKPQANPAIPGLPQISLPGKKNYVKHFHKMQYSCTSIFRTMFLVPLTKDPRFLKLLRKKKENALMDFNFFILYFHY